MTHRDDDQVDCRRFEALLGDYADDVLSPQQKAAVDEHMSMCAPCMAFLRQYKFGSECTRAKLLKSVPVEMESRLLSFLKDRCQKK